MVRRVAGNAKLRQILFGGFRKVEKIVGSYISYLARPVRMDSRAIVSVTPPEIQNKIAIVMQGPLVLEDDFTYQSLKMYRTYNPQAEIILSTWDYENRSYLDRISSLGVSVVLSSDPKYPGISNINRQIKSTKIGIKMALYCGSKYILKTRTDQRFYSPNTLFYLYNILKIFPLSSPHFSQNERLIGINLNSFKYRLYGLSDMFMFGNSQDMINYWDAPYDLRHKEDTLPRETFFTLREFAQSRVCEVYLLTEYLKRIGRDIKWTLEDSLQCYRDLFVIIDKGQIDLFWPKYTRNENRWIAYSGLSKMQETSFADWLNLQNRIVISEEEEALLDAL